MKNFLTLLLSFTILFALTGCNLKKTDAIKFKDEYESVNGETNSSGKKHRSVSIDKNNPFVYITPEELIQKIENDETFYVYFGSKLCPWCRSVIETAIEVAKENNIDTIYYIDIWDDEGNEILRDQYTVEDGKAVKSKDGAESYDKLLTLFDNVLADYTLTYDEGNEVSTSEKRIYAPNFIYVKNGEAIKLTEGTSDKQEDSREKLTDEILKDEKQAFQDFFDN